MMHTDRQMFEGYVYAIGDESGRIKVGHTTAGGPTATGIESVDTRMKSIQTGHPEKLSVLFYSPGSLADEANAHNALSKFRLVGEWFDTNKENVAAAISGATGLGVVCPNGLYVPHEYLFGNTGEKIRYLLSKWRESPEHQKVPAANIILPRNGDGPILFLEVLCWEVLGPLPHPTYGPMFASEARQLSALMHFWGGCCIGDRREIAQRMGYNHIRILAAFHRLQDEAGAMNEISGGVDSDCKHTSLWPHGAIFECEDKLKRSEEVI